MFLFAQRALMLAFATAVVLASLGYLTLVQWLIAVPCFTVIFLIVFDDITTWFRHRNDRWHLTNRRLIYERVGAPEEDAAVPLARIEWMRPWLWWALQLGFEGGTSTAMRFVSRPREIQSEIEAAQKALHPDAPKQDTESHA
ncbi:hypothetical protein RXV86_13960 [Alisedimentitalea sp. MJ-SS2]|uniref:hypothetical protein n=1 Tax=Aliisedimentitalea sp. MJ-SS2 TaxID=3049795 RepID=UPI002912D4FF|nr:hypothetical protein [Alisedimentitalea sp. MJ-SS2]MDU8928491.1 hypothetical protein [Alisedimentitalea sp. MJ-SS2]